ncbi:MAG: right-handed parallel beta-helix repeat-containing protein, partial [Candidatus Binatia bacterium]
MRILAFLGFFLLAFSSQLLAANCGGTIPCSCGDTVKQNYVMTTDLGPCSGHGLSIADGVMLDGNNHKITGGGNATENYGVYLTGTTGAVVKNVIVTNFRRGIRLSDAQENQILHTETFQNGNFSAHVGYGIDMASGAKDNLLQGNLIHDNADEGIHFGSGSGRNVFIGNTVYDNYIENIYLIASHDNTLIGNITRLGQTSAYVKDSHSNIFQDNTFQDKIVHVRGDSHDNQFINNSLVNTGFHFQVYTSGTPFRYPHDNTV